MRPIKYHTDAARLQARVEYNQRYHARRKAQAVYPDLPTGPYRVLYADPPWRYDTRDPYYHGHARDHYHTLSIPELCALPVRRIVAPKAVLFLWVTAPILAECWPVLTAWSFTYKTHLVWDKGRHNYGHYVSNEHELLLLATRGACKPDVEDRHPSIQRYARASHSTKPPQMRELIDSLYPDGRRLELFARTRAEGWDAWGNQLD